MVRKSVKVLDEKVSEHTEEVFDEGLGKNVLKTFKVIEKTLEHEVGCLSSAFFFFFTQHDWLAGQF